MRDRDDEGIARQEADETFQSISDLDSISDTMFVATTFFLAALATWTTFAINRFTGQSWTRWVFVALVIACSLSITGSVFFLSFSLAPRGFYGSTVGRPFLDSNWLLWRNDDPGNVTAFRERRQRIRSDDDLKREYETWLDNYDPAVDITSRESFELSRLLNYKLVARIKANHTAYAVALFRIATALFMFVIVVGLVGPLV